MAKETVDTRVVRMEFDNKQFEKNVKQTSKSLETLKQDLDFKGVGEGIEQVKIKISALQVAMATFIANITNKIINLGVTLVKSLSVDNISAGWAKFGEKTTSVATMMAQKIRIAGQEITDLAEKTRIVNEQLDLLTWFSDETSYSFTDMVNNVGKFIAAGQDLDKSVKAMEGIATWAAKAGQNSATASRAMYQLAQAMGKGKIQKIDWMSIQNANMDTEDFRETILATAVAMNELTKEGDKFVTKTGKKFTQSQFADFLSEGWFTSDVLITGLNKYSAAIEEIFEISEREGITASEVIEKYGDQLDEFGVAAFKAAQEARTFADVLNSVKDAVSSKWMTTFEKIFGGQADAVRLWTDLANELYDVFAESGNFRNDILSVWTELGGRDKLFAKGGPDQGAFWNLYDAIIAVRDLIKKAWNTVFPLTTMEKTSDQAEDIGRQLNTLTLRLKEFTNRIKVSTEWAERISKAFQIVFTVLKSGLIVLRTVHYIIDPIIELGKQLVGQVLDQLLYSANKVVGVSSKLETIAIKIQKTLVGLLDSLGLPEFLDEVFLILQDIFGLVETINPIERLFKVVETFITTFEEAGGSFNGIKKVILAVINVIDILKNTLIATLSVVLKAILPILDDIIEVLTKVAGYIIGTVAKVIESLADIILTLVNAIQTGDGLEPIGESITGILESIGDLAKKLIPVLGQLVPIVLKVINVLLLIPEMLNEISKQVTGRGIIENLVYIFDSIISVIANFIQGIKQDASTGSLQGLFNAIVGVFEGLYEVLKGVIASAQLLLTILGSALKRIGKAIQMICDLFIKVFSGRSSELTTAQKAMWKTIVVLLAIIAVVWIVYSVFYGLLAAIAPWGAIADSLTGAIDSFSKKMLAEAFDALATALLEIVIALALLAALDPGRMWSSIAAFTVIVSLLVGIFLMIRAMTKATDDVTKGSESLKEKMKSLFSKKDSPMLQLVALVNQIGSLMLKLALAFVVFDKLSWEGWSRGVATLGIVVGIITGLYIMTSVMNKKTDKVDSELKDSEKSFKALIKDTIILAVALKIFAKALTAVGKMSWEELFKGWSTVGILLASIGGIFAMLKFLGPKEKAGTDVMKSLIGFSIAMFAMAVSMMMLSTLPWYSLLASALAMISLIGALTASVAILTNAKGASKAKIQNQFKLLLGISVAAIALGASLLIVGTMPWYQIMASTLAMISLIGALTASLTVLSGAKGLNKRKVFNLLTMLAGISGTLLVIAGSLRIVGSMPWENILAATLAVHVVLGTLVASILVLNKLGGSDPALSMVKLAVGITAFGLSLIPLAAGLRILGSVGMESIFKGLLAVAGAILVIGVATLVLKSVIPQVLALASAMLIVGVAILVAGYGLQAIAVGLSALNNNFAPALENLTNLIQSLISGILTGITEALPNVISALEPVLSAIISTLTALAPQILELVSVVLGGVLDLLDEHGPHIIETIITLLDKLLATLNEHIDSINESVFGIVNSIARYLADNVESLGQSLIDTVIGLVKVLTKNIGPITQALIDFLIEATIALFTKIGPLIDIVTDYVFDFIARVTVAVTGKVIALAGLITKVALIVIAAVIRLTIASLGALSKLFVTFIGALLLIIVHTFMGMSNVVFSVLKTIFVESLRLLYKVISWAIPAMNAIGKVIFAAIGKGLLNALVDAFSWLIDLIPGLRDKINAGMNAINAAIDADVERTLSSLGGGVSEVQAMIEQTSSNINDVVAMTASAANEAVIDGMGQINDVVTDSMDQLGDALSQFGEEAGSNLYQGMGSSDNIDGAEQVGSDMGTAAATGFAEATETHSPSRLFARFGQFLMQGLGLGIQESSDETENAIAEVINESLALATDILNGQEGDDYTIKVGMDISGVEEQTSRIQDMMSGVNNPNLTASGQNAVYNKRALDKASDKSGDSVTNDNSTTVTYNNTFNIESTDPQQSADEIDRVLKEQNMQWKLAHGG